jgi:hypothetical protein
MPSIDAIPLTDSQMSAIARTCETLHPADRDPFLRAVTARLSGEVIGDGSISRAIRDLISTGHYRTQMTAAIGAGAAVRKRQLWRKARSA